MIGLLIYEMIIVFILLFIYYQELFIYYQVIVYILSGHCIWFDFTFLYLNNHMLYIILII